MTIEFAKRFAEEWIDSWNSHDINSIMDHYAPDLDFTSPIIKQINFNPEGIISSKKELEAYFSKALGIYKDLHFSLHDVLTGIDSLVLYYTSINNKKVAELMYFDALGKVSKVMAHYN